MAGTGSTFFSGRLFWRQLRFGGNWLQIIFRRIVSDESSSDLLGTGSTLFFGRLFWRRLRFGGNWLNIIFRLIVFEETQIWWELAPHYFLGDCIGGSSDLAGTGSTLFSGRLFFEAAQIWRELAPQHFPMDCFRLF